MAHTDIKFREEHRFTRYEVIGLVVFFIIGLTYSLLRSLYFHAFNESILSIALTTGFIAALSYILFMLSRHKLSTRVNSKNIKLRAAPLFSRYRKIKWKNVSDIQEFEISPGTELSGWMVTFGNFKDFCVSRHKGVLLTLLNGEQVFIQTDQPENFIEIFERRPSN
jgi:hypothetical protein